MAAAQGSAPAQKKRRIRSKGTMDDKDEQNSSATPADKRKVKKRSTSKRSTVQGDTPEASNVADDVCPGMLLMDFVESDAAPAPRRALAARKRISAGRKQADKDKDDLDDAVFGETDMLFSGTAADDEQADGNASERLLSAMGRLASQGETGSETAGRRRHLEEARPESEFHAGTAGEAITVDDLLAPLAETAGFGDIRKQLEGLASKEAMPEPVSEVQKTREERKVAYEQSSKDISKFVPQVQRMEKSDQVVLGEENIHEPKTTSALVGTFAPIDDFEKELEEVTRSAGTSEEQIRGSATLPMNPRIRDEKQVQQIAKLKALMLREQRTSKRVKKIKSKTYHRIHRKAEGREREALLERLEHENPELAKTLKQEYEKKYAQMRLQRNRNARKKWTQTMQRFAKGDRNAQNEISKQAQNAQDEKTSLRRAIQGKKVDQSDDSEAVDLSESDSEDDGEGKRKNVAQRTVTKAKKMTIREIKDLQKEGELPTTGILGLNFMRDAIQRKRESAKAEAENVLHELENLDSKLDSDADEDDDRPMAGKGEPKKDVLADLKKERKFTEEELAQASKEVDQMLEWDDATQQVGECSVSGPLTVRGVAAASAEAVAAAAKSLPNSGSARSSTAEPPAPVQAKASKPKGTAAAGAETAPVASRTQGTSSSSGSTAPPHPADAARAAGMAQGKTGSSSPSMSSKASPTIEENPWLNPSPPLDDADGDTDAAAADGDTEMPQDTHRLKKAAAKASKRKKRRKSTEDLPDPEEENDGETAELGSSPLTSAADLLNMLDEDTEAAREQRDLVRATFVEGTQVEDFEEEQEELQRKKEERDKPEVLVGWGHWTGAGVRPRKVAADSKGKGSGKGSAGTSDSSSPQKRSRVQMYEGDQDKKAKYFVDKVPYPFKNPKDYDQTMRMPSGPEWNTLPEHLQRVKPKVFMKVGTVVAPLQYVKHLPPEQRDNAIKAWSAAKQKKRLKARM